MVEIININSITQKTDITWFTFDFGDTPIIIRHGNNPNQLMIDIVNNVVPNIFISYSSLSTFGGIGI